MRAALTAIFASVLLCGLCVSQDTTPYSSDKSPQAQQTPTQPAQSGQSSQRAPIAPGSVIPVQLTRTIDAKKVKPGDVVEAKVTQDLKTTNGDVLLTKDAKVVGHVTEAQARSKEQKESQVGIAFDHAVMKDGSNASLPMSIQAIIAPPSQNNENAGAPGNPGAPPSASAGAGMPQSGSSGRGGSMGSAAPPPPNPSPSAGETPSGSTNASNQRPPINADTRGVIGISNYKLETENPTQGSVVSTEKGNVKLESGTLLLLRVNPANQ